jgi:dihydrofolate reductase
MRAKVYIGTSLDGFIARKDGNIDWLVQYANEEALKAYKEFMSGIDAILIGRGTFEKILSFPSWPYDKAAFLLSTTSKQVPDGLKDKITLLPMMKPAEVLQYLAQKGFSNIYVDGGKVIQSFLKEDLIDELIISKTPSLIGSGIPLFGHLDKDIQFKHIRTEVHSNDLVRSYYERRR